MAERVVFDTSALVSLETIGLLETALKIMEPVAPEEVLRELKEMSGFNDEEGRAATRVLKRIRRKEISVRPLRKRETAKRVVRAEVHEGEASAFACCLENGIAVLVCDDVDAGADLEGLARARGVKIKLSVAVIVELVRKGLLTRKKAFDAVKKMARIRRWEGGVLEYLAKKHLREL